MPSDCHDSFDRLSGVVMIVNTLLPGVLVLFISVASVIFLRVAVLTRYRLSRAAFSGVSASKIHQTEVSRSGRVGADCNPRGNDD